MDTSIALFFMASLSSVRSVLARFNDADPLNPCCSGLGPVAKS
jgi:hypothetical protein